jgi:putative membrane protein insertion efficiency factor
MIRRIVIALIKGYSYFISPFMAPSCRYTPTCSAYMQEAVEKHGVFKGVWMGIKRLSRCHPFHEGGYDPVPDPHNHSHPHDHQH